MTPHPLRVLLALVTLAAATAARAQLIITEVMSTGSSNATYAADWFELTNKGAGTVDLTGFKMDDNSHAFASAVPLRGISGLAPGQTVVFIEGNAGGTTDATVQANFITAWFGAGGAPAGFVIAGFGGAGVGLSATADEVNLFDGAGNFVTGVGFGTGTLTASFDNHASTNPGSPANLPLLSVVSTAGQFGAFTAADATAVGSPGSIANAAAVPEPATFATILGAIALGGSVLRRRRAARAG